MPDPRVDEQLAEYLEVTRSEREAGYTLPNLFRTIKTVADGLAAHEVECLRYRRATDARLDALELSSRLAEQSRLALLALPPPRPPEGSTVDIEGFAKKVAEAAVEGAQRPDSTPEEAMRPIVVEEMKRRDEQRELARLRQAEVDHLAAIAKQKADDAETALRIAEAKASTRRNAIAQVVGGVSLAGLLELLRWAATLHH